MTSCLVSCSPTPSKKESTQKGKNLLPRGANSFLLELTPFQKGGKKIDKAASPESVSIPPQDRILSVSVKNMISVHPCISTINATFDNIQLYPKQIQIC